MIQPLVVLILAGCALGQDPLAWPPATRQSRPWSYWWWMGSAVDRPNLARELERYRDAGWGGVHIIPIYGAKGYESRYTEYLSPKWMELLRHTVTEAGRLDLGVDMTTGTGWCFGGPNVSGPDACAVVAVQTHEVAAGGRLTERFDRERIQALVAFGPGGRRAELLGRIGSDGTVDWSAEGGPWRVYAVSQQVCRTPVKRAAPGGEGPMLNPLRPSAIRIYLVRFTQAFAGYQGPRPRSMYHDSFEYQVNWSPDLFAEFARRRGYRLELELDALFGPETGDRAARVKSDYRETVSDLLSETFLPTWRDWAHQQGFVVRNQAHGSPANLLDLYAAADIPETEMFHRDRNPLVSKLASSAAHLAGRTLVASETGTWLREHFQETLADLKDLVDLLFLSGVNHVFYHGTCYSPDDAPWPGWLFYASTQMNPRNPIWRDVPALNRYITRVQSILQSGQPENDILLYWPIYDLWHDGQGLGRNLTVHDRQWLEDQPVGRLAQRLWDRGYVFDFVSDRQLLGLNTAKVVLVPASTHIPLATMNKLLALAAGGTKVVFEDHLPSDVPGLADVENRRRRLRELGQGRAVVGDAEAALGGRESLVDHPGLQFARRTSIWGRHYFLANRGPRPVDGWVRLATPAAAALLLDPLTGRTGAARLRPAGTSAVDVYLQLDPGHSIVVRTFSERRALGPAWTYWRPNGAPVEIRGRWQVEFVAGGPELPRPLEMRRLKSWVAGDDATRDRFAGTARYTIRFDAPSTVSAWRLDLGVVRESARVRLNGQDLGTIFLPPYRLPIRKLKPQGNVLEVEVTSLAANRIRDLDRRRIPWRLFHDINFVNLNYRPFDASDWPLRDAGLLGPVTLGPGHVH